MPRNILSLLFPLSFVMILGLLACNTGSESIDEGDAEMETDTLSEVQETMFGYIVDEIEVYNGEIDRNQNLSDILQQFRVSYSDIVTIANIAKEIFDVRNIQAGKPYCILTSNDTSQQVKCFVYQQNPVEYVVFNFGDSLSVYQGRKDVEIKRQEASGIIYNSLYLTLEENNISPVLALHMSDIYAWAIDFYRIQSGDRFKVIYDVKYVDGEAIGVDKVVASYFQHYDRDFYAFYFEHDSVSGDYFDEEANSLRKAFLKAPLKFSTITSGYSMNRKHPVTKVNKPHLGTDYAAPTGTPIMSVGDGVITEATFKKYNGNYVKVKHNSVYTTQYLHMSKIADGIKPGVYVKQGDIIGYVGSTGLATGPHVCFRFWKNGAQVDPRKEEIPPSKPVDPEYVDIYMEYMGGLKNQLDAIEYPQQIAAVE